MYIKEMINFDRIIKVLKLLCVIIRLQSALRLKPTKGRSAIFIKNKTSKKTRTLFI